MKIFSYMGRGDYLFFLVLFILTACAKPGLPPGGEEDRTPPDIIRTIPLPGETGIDTRTGIQVWFSEGIQPSSASAIFITPYPGEDVKFKWRGRKLKITFPQPLKTDRTYVITFGTGIRDYRNNALETSYTLAFSTGTELDEGEISGRVFGISDARGIDVWAYEIEDSLNPDPSFKESDYIVQCEAGGDFRFSYLSPGLYRLFAVRDRVSDRLYQAGEDEVGVTFRDVFLSRDEVFSADSLYFRMMKEDTTGPSLIRAFSQNRHHFTLRFDEAISSRHIFSKDSLWIVSMEDSLDTLSIRRAYIDPLNPQILHILTQAQNSGMRYRITVGGIWDEAGNTIDPEYRMGQFDGIGKPDTIPPVLVRTVPKPGEKSVSLEGVVRLIFSEAVDSVRFGEGFFLTETSGEPVEGIIRWSNPSEIVFVPRERLESFSTYEIEILGKGAVDLAGNPLVDTLFQFQTLDGDTLSEISGKVFDSDSGAIGEIHVITRQVDNPEIEYTQVLPEPGEYRFRDILPGRYLLESFRDRDGDGKYSFGRPFPYFSSERFVVYLDTVRVRSKWPNEGNDLRLP